MRKPESGIYAIKNATNGKAYVGSAVNIGARWKLHKSQLRRGIHHSHLLQAAWNKYGEASFEFVVLELVDDVSCLLPAEDKWIGRYKSANRDSGYNVCPQAGSQLGMRHSEAARKKMSEAHRGRKKSDEHQAAINAALRGRNLSLEHREKIADIRTGTKASDAAREKMRLAHSNPRETLSAESYHRMVTANVGRKFSDEHRRKIGEANSRRTLSPETRAKISDARKRSEALKRSKMAVIEKLKNKA